MIEIELKTKGKKQVLDITQKINQELKNQEKNKGTCHLFIHHTTASLTTADLDPGTDKDMLKTFKKIIPDLDFNHPHNPSHAPDHIISSIISPSIMIPFKNKKLVLGTWQRVVLIELNGPRTRKITLTTK